MPKPDIELFDVIEYILHCNASDLFEIDDLVSQEIEKYEGHEEED